MAFDRWKWWEKWHPDKAPGKGRAKLPPTPPGKPIVKPSPKKRLPPPKSK